MRKILLVIMVLGIIGISVAGTFADFSDIEVSADNMFESGQWRNGMIYIDVKPWSCPNPINVNSGGVLQIAILGTKDFPVDDLDPTSVRVWRDDLGGNVKPIRYSEEYEDTATPFYPTSGGDCCHDLTGDGIVDLNVEFNKTALVNDLKLDEIPHKTTIYLRVTVLDDEGNQLDGKDCVRILNTPKKSATTDTTTTDDESGDDNPKSMEGEGEEDVE